MSLGDNIRKRRIELHLSQQELADALGYKTRSSIAKIEKNSSSISQRKLSVMANVLHTSVEYLITGTAFAEDQPGSVLDSESIQELILPPKEKRKCVAVILAGGEHRVNRLNIPLQFVTVKDRPVIIYTMQVFQHHPMIEEIYVVCLDGWESFIPAYAEKYNISKLKDIIPAGETGILSVKNAVEWVSASHSPYDILVLHEATRPMVDPEILSNAILCCSQYGSGVTFERMDRMTPFLENDSGKGLSHLPAERLINVQSPEAYSMGVLRKAFYDAAACNHSFNETICAVFLHNMGIDLRFCEGNHNNFRVISEDDLRLLAAIIS